MEELQENKILINESLFTYLCKVGFLTHQSQDFGKTDIHFYKIDILSLSKGDIVIKEIGGEVFKFVLQNIDPEMVREIVKRSPIYHELSNQI